jgi:hypothetical protein
MLDALLSPALLTAVALALSHGRFVDAKAESSFRETLATHGRVGVDEPAPRKGWARRTSDGYLVPGPSRDHHPALTAYPIYKMVTTDFK